MVNIGQSGEKVPPTGPKNQTMFLFKNPKCQKNFELIN